MPSLPLTKSKLPRVVRVAEVRTVVSAFEKSESRSTPPSSIGAAARTRFPFVPLPRDSSQRTNEAEESPGRSTRRRAWPTADIFRSVDRRSRRRPSNASSHSSTNSRRARSSESSRSSLPKLVNRRLRYSATASLDPGSRPSLSPRRIGPSPTGANGSSISNNPSAEARALERAGRTLFSIRSRISSPFLVPPTTSWIVLRIPLPLRSSRDIIR